MKQFNIIILRPDERQYNITVHSEYQLSAILDELPTYIYQLIGDKLLLQSDSAFTVLQKNLYMDELKSLLIELNADPLKMSFESGDDHFMLQESSLGTLIMLLTGLSESSGMVMREIPTALSATAFLEPQYNVAYIKQCTPMISNGFWGDGVNYTILKQEVPTTIIFSYVGGAYHTALKAINTLQGVTKYINVHDQLLLPTHNISLGTAALLGRVGLNTTLSSSSMTPSRGFNADGLTKASLGESSMALIMYALLSFINTMSLNTGDISTWSAKYEQADNRIIMRTPTISGVIGHPRYLYEMDDKALSEFDSLSMEQVDYITINE